LCAARVVTTAGSILVEHAYYLTHLVGTVVRCPLGHQAGSILVEHTYYLTHLVGTVVCRPRGHQARSILVKHAHQLPQPAALHHTSSNITIFAEMLYNI
jgi:hypothetical protein